VAVGDNAGELKFGFGKTTPDADTYTLYYMEGTGDVETIRSEGQSRDVSGAVKSGGGGILDNLYGNATYSLVMVAEKRSYDALVSGTGSGRTGFASFASGPAEFGIKRGGINPYGHHLGAIDHRALAYSFGDSTPAADVYRIYFAEGAGLSAQTIIDAGRFVRAQPKTADKPGYIGGVADGWVSETDTYTWRENNTNYTGDYVKEFSFTIPDDAPIFEIDKEYSVVIVARKAGHDNIYSDVISIGKVPNITLTIPNLVDPSEDKHIRVAVVLTGRNAAALISPAQRRPLGVGYRDPGTKTFVFYELDKPGDVFGKYDSTKPWLIPPSNTQPLALSDTERQPPSIFDGSSDGHYRYISTTGGFSLGLPTPRAVNIEMVMQFPWNQFGRQ